MDPTTTVCSWNQLDISHSRYCCSVKNQFALFGSIYTQPQVEMDGPFCPYGGWENSKTINLWRIGKGDKEHRTSKLHYKDWFKELLYKCNIGLDNWETLAEDRVSCRAGIADDVRIFHEKNIHHKNIQNWRERLNYHQLPTWPCAQSSRICVFRVGLFSHQPSHQHSIVYDCLVLACFEWPTWFRLCKSRSGLTRYMKGHTASDDDQRLLPPNGDDMGWNDKYPY